MGYRVLGRTEDVMQGYGPRPGLEGPFPFDGMILYYDPKEGRYWNPKTDFYMEHEEMSVLHNNWLSKMTRGV